VMRMEHVAGTAPALERTIGVDYFAAFTQRPRSAVVSEWSAELAKHPQSRHLLRVSPQVRALHAYQGRAPRAGVAGSNPPRRTSSQVSGLPAAGGRSAG